MLASSGKADQVDRYLDLLDPAPLQGPGPSLRGPGGSGVLLLLLTALRKLGEPDDAAAVVVGDSVYDVEAAKPAGMPALVVRSGGFGDDELRTAGAVALYDTPADVTAALDETPLS